MIRLFAAIVFCLLAWQAEAAKAPAAVRQDPRIRVIPYDPDQVVTIVATVGIVLTLEFREGESVAEVALSDSANLDRKATGDRFVYLKPTAPMPPKSLFVHTKCPDGSSRMYVIELGATEQKGGYFLVRFTDPAAESRAAWVKEKQQRRKRDEEDAEKALKSSPPPSINRDYRIEGASAPIVPRILQPGAVR